MRGAISFDERRAYWAMLQDIIDRGGMEERFDLDEMQRDRDPNHNTKGGVK